MRFLGNIERIWPGKRNQYRCILLKDHAGENLMKKFSFKECRKYIEACKTKSLFLGIKGHEVRKHLGRESREDKVLIAISKRHRIILVSLAKGFIGFHFDENEFEREENLSSYASYEQESYNFSIFQMDSKKILTFLRSDEDTLSTEYEEIDFELGFRLRKSFLASSNVIGILYYWSNGPMLVCTKEKGDERFFFSDSEKNITQEEALQRARSHAKDNPCSMKVLLSEPAEKSHAEDDEDSDEGLIDLALPKRKGEPSNIIQPLELSESSLVAVGDEEAKESPSEDSRAWTNSIFEDEEELADLDLNPQKTEIDTEQELGTAILEAQELPPEEKKELEKYQRYTIQEAVSPIAAEAEASPDNQLLENVDDEDNPFEKSVLLSVPEITPPSEDRLKTYGTETTKIGEVLSKTDVKVLARYGIKLPKGEKSTAKEVLEAYNLAVSRRKLRRVISIKDQPLFRRFQLPIPPQSFAEKLQERLPYIIMPLAVTVLVLLGIWISQLYYERQLKKEKMSFCLVQLEKFDQYQMEVMVRLQEIKKTLDNLSQNFPADQGYPEPDSEILARVQEIEQHLVGMIATTENIRKLFDENLEQCYGFLNLPDIADKIRFFEDPLGKVFYLRKLDQLEHRTQQIARTVQFLDKKKKEDQTIRQAGLLLQKHIVVLEQKNKTLVENWALVQEKYPVGKGFPIPPDTEKLIQETKQQVSELSKYLRGIEDAMLANPQKALELASSHLTLGEVDSGKLDATIQSLNQHIQTCENILKEKKLEYEIDVMFKQIDQLAVQCQAELDEIQKCKIELDRIPAELGAPRPDKDEAVFLEKAKQEISKLKNSIQDVRSFRFEKKLLDAQALLKKLLSQEYPLAKLRQLKTNAQNAVRLAKNMKARSDLAKQIALLLQVTQDGLANLESTAAQMEQKVATIQGTYPASQGFPRIKAIYQPGLKKAQGLREQLRGKVKESLRYIDQQNLDAALDTLNAGQSMVQQIPGLVGTLVPLNDQLNEELKQLESLALERKQLAQLAEKKSRVENYLQELRAPLDRLNACIQQYEAEISKDGLPPEVAPLAQTGNTLVKNIQDLLKQSSDAVQAKDYEKANELLDPIRMNELLNRDLIAKLSIYRGNVESLLNEALVVKTRNLKKSQSKELFAEIQQRKNELAELRKKMQDKQAEWKTKYPGKPYLPIDSNTGDAIQEADYEIEELEKVLTKAQEDIDSGEYDRGLGRLSVYRLQDNPDVSKIYFIRSVHEKILKIAQENERIDQDPSYREGILEKQKLEAERQKRLAEWEKQSPGAWYESLKQAIAIYDSLETQMSNSLKDKGAVAFYPRLKAQIAEFKRIPKAIAAVEEGIFEFRQAPARLTEMVVDKIENSPVPRQQREGAAAKKYLETREISIENPQKIAEWHAAWLKLQQDLTGPNPMRWIPEDRIRELHRIGKEIWEDFDEHYQPIYSTITTFAERIKAERH